MKSVQGGEGSQYLVPCRSPHCAALPAPRVIFRHITILRLFFFLKLLFYLFKRIFKILIMKGREHVRRRQCSGGGQRHILGVSFLFLLYMSELQKQHLTLMFVRPMVSPLRHLTRFSHFFYFFFFFAIFVNICNVYIYIATHFHQLSPGPLPAHPPPSLMSPLL